jgi:hypothetical protein
MQRYVRQFGNPELVDVHGVVSVLSESVILPDTPIDAEDWIDLSQKLPESTAAIDRFKPITYPSARIISGGPCPNCGSTSTRLDHAQLRAADEAETVTIYCESCDKTSSITKH